MQREREEHIERAGAYFSPGNWIRETNALAAAVYIYSGARWWCCRHCWREMYKSAVVWKIVIILCSRARTAALFLGALRIFLHAALISRLMEPLMKIIITSLKLSTSVVALLLFIYIAAARPAPLRNTGRLHTSRQRAAMVMRCRCCITQIYLARHCQPSRAAVGYHHLRPPLVRRRPNNQPNNTHHVRRRLWLLCTQSYNALSIYSIHNWHVGREKIALTIIKISLCCDHSSHSSTLLYARLMCVCALWCKKHAKLDLNVNSMCCGGCSSVAPITTFRSINHTHWRCTRRENNEHVRQ